MGYRLFKVIENGTWQTDISCVVCKIE